MITFLPFPDFKQSLACLDNIRLRNQKRETLAILSLVTDNKLNHPAVKMWKNNLWQLCQYGMFNCLEILDRGFDDKSFKKFLLFATKLEKWDHPGNVLELNVLDGIINKQLPSWWGDKRVHESHKSRLLSKKPEHYLQYFSGVPIYLNYYWPV